MVAQHPSFRSTFMFALALFVLVYATAPALAQDGSVLNTLENQVVTAAKGWETTIMNAARSLF